MKLTIIIPVFNEKNSFLEVLERVSDTPFNKQIIVVDDCSTDGTREIIQGLSENDDITVVMHEKNQGKGAAIASALPHIKGDIVIIQDADLEYDPSDYEGLIQPIKKGAADVVYGSRFMGPQRAIYFWHLVGNKFLSFVTNILYNTTISDMETGYKAFKSEVLEGMTIRAKKFDFEPEITAKVIKKGYRLYQVPISYYGRSYTDGKKITWRDGFSALWTLVKYKFID